MKETFIAYKEELKVKLLYIEALIEASNYKLFIEIVDNKGCLYRGELLPYTESYINDYKQHLFKFINNCINKNIAISDVLLKWYYSDDNLIRREKYRQKRLLMLHEKAIKDKRKANIEDCKTVEVMNNTNVTTNIISYAKYPKFISSAGLVVDHKAFEYVLAKQEEISNRNEEFMRKLKERVKGEI